MTAARWIVLCLIGLGQGDLAARSWTRAAARRQLESVLGTDRERSVGPNSESDAIWAGPLPVPDAIAAVAALHYPQLKELVGSTLAAGSSAEDFTKRLGAIKLDPFVAANVRLALGQELTRRRRFDEALLVLEVADIQWVADPAAYHFHRGACQFSMGRAEDLERSAEELARLPNPPQRYRVTMDAMRAAAKSLSPASLAGIAHDMKDVHRRLELGLLDQKVVELEKDVLARLDRLIEELDDHENEDLDGDASDGSGDGAGGKGSKRAKGAGGGTAPAQPAEESRLLGGKGEGEVDDRSLDDERSWGNLPDKEREKALQEVSRDFPSHYRDAVEQYFRRLATAPGGR